MSSACLCVVPVRPRSAVARRYQSKAEDFFFPSINLLPGTTFWWFLPLAQGDVLEGEKPGERLAQASTWSRLQGEGISEMNFLSLAFDQHARVFLTCKWQVLLVVRKKNKSVISQRLSVKKNKSVISQQC